MKLRDAILSGTPSAVGHLADVIRSNGGTHADVVARVQVLYREAGRIEPSLAEIDGWLRECDEAGEASS